MADQKTRNEKLITATKTLLTWEKDSCESLNQANGCRWDVKFVV